MVTSVSITKKYTNIIKKLIFSIGVFGRFKVKIGFKNIYATTIFNVVRNKKVNPTELMLFCLTLSKIKIRNAEKKKKKKYNNEIG
ncbi:MAG: hypothetical protein IM568_00385 [Flavobacterium sp.]|nr:hypothetical protein [Flavobacterium sp.]